MAVSRANWKKIAMQLRIYMKLYEYVRAHLREHQQNIQPFMNASSRGQANAMPGQGYDK
jgi:hypothetical protein